MHVGYLMLFVFPNPGDVDESAMRRLNIKPAAGRKAGRAGIPRDCPGTTAAFAVATGGVVAGPAAGAGAADGPTAPGGAVTTRGRNP